MWPLLASSTAVTGHQAHSATVQAGRFRPGARRASSSVTARLPSAASTCSGNGPSERPRLASRAAVTNAPSATGG